jgi:hypothetical protein
MRVPWQFWLSPGLNEYHYSLSNGGYTTVDPGYTETRRLGKSGGISRLISLFLLFPTRIPLSGVGATCFSSCCDKDSAIIFTTGRLPDVNPP